MPYVVTHVGYFKRSALTIGKSAPKAPDPVATANAQAAANKEAAITSAQINQVDQVTPFGSLTYTQRGTTKDGTPQYTATQTLSPDQQGLYDSSVQAQQQFANIANQQLYGLGNTLASPFRIDGSRPAPSAPYYMDNRPVGGIPPGAVAGTFHGGGQPISSTFDYGPQQAATMGNVPGRTMRIDTTGMPEMRDRASASQGVRYTIDDAGQIQRSFGDAGDVRRTLDYSAFGDPNIERQRVEEALLSRLNPQLEQDRQALETRLANQGLVPGTQAYDDAYDVYNRQVNDARIAAILNAGQEQSRLAGLGLAQGQFENAAQQQVYDQLLGRGAFANQAQAQQYGQNANDASFWNQAQSQEFGQDLTNANLANAARAQAVNEALSLAEFQNAQRDATIQENLLQRTQPINEITALLNGTQLTSPSFVNTPTQRVDPADIMGATYANYQQQAANANAANQGLYGLLGTGLMAGAYAFSDRRLKTNIRRIGRLANGLAVYAFRYVWGEDAVGLMADEVKRVKPWAVARVGGFDAVNYAEAVR